MTLLYQTGLLQSIAYLMGERTVNSTTSGARADFLQKTIEEAYKAYPWRFARTTATVPIASGIATLPTLYDNSHPLDVIYTDPGGTQYMLNEIEPGDKDLVIDGDFAYWITSQPDGSFLLKTKDTQPGAVAVSFQQTAPVLDSGNTVGVPYPSAMTLAYGARRFVKLSQNPDADISQDEAIFQQRLAKDIAAEQVTRARKRHRSRQFLTGRSTGDF